ncbi:MULTISPECIES: alpha/beta hydrolase [unclassified Kitasatospora]|uniref:alpha/beta hydrolase n=1 Tax=unclassified Kitasatospora TaxID=2633591 RepID=UPI00070B9228|nr:MULTISPECIES: alpha/beta hydrolase [unclassified Kitasatospora]KQV12600.1 hypothetical protein ASC99_34190 [Kitasatospora sp. Root107]KRB67728.1 hypothetical protein ASE03_30335 [Kitasatospora sp. Root187]
MADRPTIDAEAPLLPPSFLPPPPAVTGPDGSRRIDGATYARTMGYRPRLLDLHLPPVEGGAVPVVVWIHGGGWADGDRRYPPPTLPAELLFGSLTEAGIAVASIDYRHSLEAPFPAQLHDVRSAIRYVRHFAAELGIDPTRLALWGESAGAHLALLATLAPATTPDGLDLDGAEGVIDGDSGSIRAVVDWYGPAELVSAAAGFPPALELPPVGHPVTALLGAEPGQRPDLYRAASPTSYAGHRTPPVLIIHGTADQVVPYSQSELLADLLRPHTDVELITVPGADHIFVGADIEPLVARSVAFLTRHLAA